MRWSTLGRLTPAAATFTRISFGCGAGFGACATRSTSGPPGSLISTARIVVAIIPRRGGAPVAQFRVEFVLDQESGKYLAELYNPENHEELRSEEHTSELQSPYVISY